MGRNKGMGALIVTNKALPRGDREEEGLKEDRRAQYRHP